MENPQSTNHHSVEKKLFTCVKCKKEKREEEGVFVYEGSAYCCRECCGNSAKGEENKKKTNVCEFC